MAYHVKHSQIRVVASALLAFAGVVGFMSPTTAVTDPLPPLVIGSVFPTALDSSLASAAGISAALEKSLSANPLNKSYSVLVVDPVTQDVLYSKNQDVSLKPASTLKILTAIAALKVLGSQTRFTTSVWREGTVLTLVGGGDPTLVSGTPKKWRGKPAGVEQPPSLDQLADAINQEVTDRGTPFVLNYDASYFTGKSTADSWSPEYVPDGEVSLVTGLTVDFGVTRQSTPYGDTGLWAAQYLARALTARGLPTTVGESMKPAMSATDIVHVESTTVGGIVERMLTTSNNTMAEFLAHHIGRAATDSSFEGSALAEMQALSQLGIDMNNVELHDGSGLSLRNRVSARTLMSALTLDQSKLDTYWYVTSGLPIAGVSGTLKDRYVNVKYGRGYVHAKTGTLSSASSLAGEVIDVDGQLLYFVFLDNGVKSGIATRPALDQLAISLAQCGCK